MASASTLWTFAHRALASAFHQAPAKFVATLDGNAAVGFLERNWKWALDATSQRLPEKPSLQYGIDRPRPGLAILWMTFQQVSATGEPWQARFIVRDPDPDGTKGYTRMFLLEHSEYATELAAKPQAIVCESLADGRHRNWAATMAPDDEAGFDRFVIETLRTNPKPSAEYVPPK